VYPPCPGPPLDIGAMKLQRLQFLYSQFYQQAGTLRPNASDEGRSIDYAAVPKWVSDEVRQLEEELRRMYPVEVITAMRPW